MKGDKGIRMIAIRPIADHEQINCPHCGAGIVDYTLHGNDLIGEGCVADDGDTLFVPLTSEQTARPGASANVLLQGSRPCCNQAYIILMTTFVDEPPDEDVENRFFHLNEDRGPQTNYRASLADRDWIITRYASRLGPVLEHTFGPFAWADTSWVGPWGVASCQDGLDGSPWSFAEQFVSQIWDELAALTGRPEFQITEVDQEWIATLPLPEPSRHEPESPMIMSGFSDEDDGFAIHLKEREIAPDYSDFDDELPFS